ncbi:hypothetical protein CRYUN_Cryun17cG0012400 [Craigia yunnanensis]
MMDLMTWSEAGQISLCSSTMQLQCSSEHYPMESLVGYYDRLRSVVYDSNCNIECGVWWAETAEPGGLLRF